MDIVEELLAEEDKYNIHAIVGAGAITHYLYLGYKFLFMQHDDENMQKELIFPLIHIASSLFFQTHHKKKEDNKKTAWKHVQLNNVIFILKLLLMCLIFLSQSFSSFQILEGQNSTKLEV